MAIFWLLKGLTSARALVDPGDHQCRPFPWCLLPRTCTCIILYTCMYFTPHFCRILILYSLLNTILKHPQTKKVAYGHALSVTITSDLSVRARIQVAKTRSQASTDKSNVTPRSHALIALLTMIVIHSVVSISIVQYQVAGAL